MVENLTQVKLIMKEMHTTSHGGKYNKIRTEKPLQKLHFFYFFQNAYIEAAKN